MIGIYKIENKANGKVYIGQSIDIDTRWYNHIRELNGNRHCNPHFQRAWNKYGKDNFEFMVIEECTVQNIDERETYWIDYYKAIVPKYGYNITAGGQGRHGYSWSEEDKERLSKIQNPYPILQIDLDGNIVERWRSASYAARELKIPVSGIMNCVREDGDQYQSHGYIWIYEKFYYDKNFSIVDYIEKYIASPKRIIERDLYGKYIATWEQTYDIGIVYGFNSSEYKEIISNLKHKRRSCIGRIFMYETDDFELTEEYLRDIRIKTGNYKINQFDNVKNLLKTWTIEELKNTKYRFDTIRKCCTDNLLGHKVNGTAFSYIWEYE